LFQTTRRRLATWYLIITTVVLLVFASGVFFYVRSTLIERIDDTLNHVVEVVLRSIAIDGQGQIDVAESFHNNTADLEDDHIDLELFNAQGRLLWSTWTDPLTFPLHNHPRGETLAIDPQHLLRQITQPVKFHSQTIGWLRVSHPWFEVTKPTQELFLDLLLGTTLMVAVVSGVSWFLSGLAMEPVKASYQQLKQFTADASHELRNPLATIQTNVQVALAAGDALPAEQQQQFQVIERLTRRLGKLVDDLLFLARQDSGDAPIEWETVPLDALLMEVVAEQELAAKARGLSLNLEIAAAPTEFNVYGDWNQLARLFTNLITNGLQYTPAHHADGRVTVKLAAHGSHLQVTVADRGIGIAAADLPRLLDRFYRVKAVRGRSDIDGVGGSGLGLSIVQAIVARHQGELSITSHTADESLGVFGGTEVVVSLPLER
jgi:two-component system, OmpR family, manganese sensing sensor histidine kinase